MKKTLVIGNDLMQQDYRYYLTEPVGKNFHPDFRPELTRKTCFSWASSAANT